MLKHNVFMDILKTLPQNIELASYTTVKIGGPADAFFAPQTTEELAQFIKQKPAGLPLTLLGEGSNMVIRDGGIRGVVIHLKNLGGVSVNGTKITAQAGATCGKVARTARENGLAGLAFFCGIPGSVGGALKMNAGCYGCQTADDLVDVQVMTAEGELRTLSPDFFNYAYRHSELPKEWVFLGATWQLEEGDKEELRAEMKRINAERRESQPLNMPSSGSWFKNITLPDGTKKNAWRIVDEAGCRGWRVGDAQVSEKHCNFFVNLGQATAAQMEELSQKVEKEVERNLGVKLEREVRFLGEE